MKLLDRHIFLELLGPFVFGVAAFAALMFASQELFRITEMLSKYHMPVSMAVKFVLLSLPKYIVLPFPWLCCWQPLWGLAVYRVTVK